MSNGSKIAAIITVAAFAGIIFFSILYYTFSSYLTESWSYLLSKDFSIAEFFSSFWIEIILVILIILVLLYFIHSAR